EADSKDELLGSLDKIVAPDMLQEFCEELIAIAEGRTFFEGEISDRTLKGKPLQLWRTIVFPREDSKFNSILVALTDKTERRQVEKQLRESEARLLTVLEASPIPITLNTQDDGIVLYGNTALADFLGVPLAAIIGQKATAFYFDPEDRGRAIEEINRTGSIHDFEVRLKRPDGSVRWVSLSTERTVIEGQVCLLSTFYDITGRKQAEALQSAVYHISEAANKSSSLDELFSQVHSIIGQVMPAQNFYIALYDADEDLVSFPYYVDEVDKSESIPPTRPGRGMTEYLLRTGKPLLSDSSNFEDLAQRGEVELVGPPSPIWVGVPLIVEGRTIGVIALQDYHDPNAYTERELRMLEYVSGQVAKAIERTRLYADIQQTNRILSALQVVTVPLIKQTELSEVLQEILRQASGLFDTTNAYIYLAKPDDSEIILSMGVGPSNQFIGTRLNKGEGLAGMVWQTGKALHVDDYNMWTGRSAHFEDVKFHATAAVPLIAKSKIMGVLGIGYIVPDHRFDAADLELLNRFAELAAIAIENSRLYTMSQQELAERKFAEEALRETEAKYRAVVEHSPAITYTAATDESKTLLFISPQVESLLGYTQEEYLAEPDLWSKTLHPDDRERVLEEVRRLYESGRPFISEYRHIARDGRWVWFHDEAVVFEDQTSGRRFIQGIKVDITQRMQAEALQEAIYRISNAASTSNNMDELYASIHRALQEVIVADNFFIALYDRETDLLSFPYYVDEHDPVPPTAPLEDGLTAYVIRKGIPLLGRPDSIQMLEDNGEVTSTGTRSIDWLGVPLKVQNETFGAMAVQTYTEGVRYSQRDLDILNFVSTQVALSIERKRAEEHLRDAEGRYRTLVEQLPVVVYVNPASQPGYTIYVSPQIKDFLGYTREEWLKDPEYWSETLHPEDRARVLEAVRRINQTGEPFDEEYRMIARDGSVVWIRDQATLMHDANGVPHIWQGLMMDITESKLAQERINRQVERLKSLRTIDMFIASGTDLHLTLQTILNQALAQLQIEAADILLLNTSMHTLEFSEGAGFRTRGIEQAAVRLGEGFAGKAALERETIIIRDLSAGGEAAFRKPLFAAEGFISYVGMPLIAKGEVKGVMEVFLRSSLEMDAEWIDFLESLSGQAALAIDNASLFESLQRSNLELGMAYETTLEGWSAALDLRDKETEGHTRRVTDLTLQLAEAMGLSERERVHIRRGALLHDIGKMGIPDRILLKPDTLTDEEWEIMRQHPTYAFKLLSPISHLGPALDIPYCHHERWDGSGYPRGLKGEAIPLAARIFTVADVYDALCSDRPYRPSWTREKALEYIKSLSGMHFDPRVVDVFLGMVGGTAEDK
ncbi:MAG TPA: GAF domain-containing protein, partial [Anaerolineales bacterium]|nr:GAF domain-containing protein [Anaerolineales bacterium]